jgi:hypothetical protein
VALSKSTKMQNESYFVQQSFLHFQLLTCQDRSNLQVQQTIHHGHDLWVFRIKRRIVLLLKKSWTIEWVLFTTYTSESNTGINDSKHIIEAVTNVCCYSPRISNRLVVFTHTHTQIRRIKRKEIRKWENVSVSHQLRVKLSEMMIEILTVYIIFSNNNWITYSCPLPWILISPLTNRIKNWTTSIKYIEFISIVFSKKRRLIG